MPGAREIRFVCWAALLVSLTLVALSVVYAARQQQFLGHQPGGDFVTFYAAGTILNEYPHAKLYDLSLQYRVEHASLPAMTREFVDPYVNTPFLGWLFRPLARLPFLWSYGAWMAISSALYLGGLALLWPKGIGSVSQIPFLACCSFLPFTIECLAGGQISALGFFAFALSTRWLRSGRLLAAGAVLSLCLYKPPLLVLVVPMLVIGRRWWTLAGFAAGAGVLGALSVAAVGYAGCASYVQALGLRAGLLTRNPSPLALFKFVDVHALFRLLLGVHLRGGQPIALVVAVAAVVYLAVRWARSRPGTRAADLLWAATIAWTLVFNIYVPIYDTILIVVTCLVMAGAVYGTGSETVRSDRDSFQGWMLALWVAAAVSQAVAAAARFQILTVVLVAIGALALRWSRRFEGAGG